MSRSRKKNPYHSLCGSGSMKEAKKQANIEVRRTNDEDLPDGKHYKKMNDRWSWPDDGKILLDDNPKWFRK